MLNKNYTNLGLKTAFFFAGISLPVIIAAWFMLPETSRRSPGRFAFRRSPTPRRLTDEYVPSTNKFCSRAGRAVRKGYQTVEVRKDQDASPVGFGDPGQSDLDCSSRSGAGLKRIPVGLGEGAIVVR
jgi:hypothetical protein